MITEEQNTTEIKNYYRYYVLVETNGQPTVKYDEIPLEITNQDGYVKILGYTKTPTDYGFTPRSDHIGRIVEGYLWLEEDNIEKARDIFVKEKRNDIQECMAQINKLKERIQTNGNFVKALEDLTFEIKHYDPNSLHQLFQDERDEV